MATQQPLGAPPSNDIGGAPGKVFHQDHHSLDYEAAASWQLGWDQGYAQAKLAIASGEREREQAAMLLHQAERVTGVGAPERASELAPRTDEAAAEAQRPEADRYRARNIAHQQHPWMKPRCHLCGQATWARGGGMGQGPSASTFQAAPLSTAPAQARDNGHVVIQLLRFRRYDDFRHIFLQSEAWRDCRRALAEEGLSMDLSIYGLGPGKLVVESTLAWPVLQAFSQQFPGRTLPPSELLVSQFYKQRVLESVSQGGRRANYVICKEDIEISIDT